MGDEEIELKPSHVSFMDIGLVDSAYFKFVDERRKVSIRVLSGLHSNVPGTGRVQIFELKPGALNFLVFEEKPTVLKAVDVSTSFTTLGGIFNPAISIFDGISKDQIEDRASNSLAEVLDVLPGIHAANTGVGIGKPMVRGFIGNRVQVLNNGVIQEGQQWGLDHGLEIDQFSVDRIQIINGAEALTHGSGMQLGAVDIESHMPYQNGFNSDIRSIYKSNNNLLGVTARVGHREVDTNDRSTSYMFQLSLQDFGDYRVPSDEFVYNGFELPLPEGILKNTAGTEWNAHARYFTQLTNRKGIWINYSHFDQIVGLFPGATGIPRAFDIEVIGNKRNVSTPYQSTIHDKLSATYSLITGDVYELIIFGAQLNRREEHSQPHAHGLTYIDSSNTLALDLDLLTLEGKYSWEKDTYEKKYKFGVSSQYQVNNQGGWEFLLASYNRLEAGAYGFYSWSTTSWRFNSALRVDASTISTDSYAQPWYSQPDSLVERVGEVNRQFVVPSASFGWQYLADDFSFSGHGDFVSRMPEGNELASNGVHHGTFRHEVGNPDLNSEYGGHVESTVAYSTSFNSTIFSTLDLKLTVFNSYYGNFIYLNPSGRFSPLPDAGQLYQYEQSPMYQYGGELYLKVELDILPQYSINLIGLSDALWSQNSSNGEYLPFQPPPSITGITELRFADGLSLVVSKGYALGVEYQHVLAQNRVARNERPTPSYSLFNVYGNYEYRFKGSAQKIDLYLRIQNLTNQAYLRHLSRYRILNLPEQGINFILQVKYSF